MFNNLSPPENPTVYEIWTNIVVSNRAQMTIWRTRISRWIPKATNTHSEYVILLAFPLQQWLHERASILPVLSYCDLHIIPLSLLCCCVCYFTFFILCGYFFCSFYCLCPFSFASSKLLVPFYLRYSFAR